MPKVKVNKNTTLTATETFEKISRMLEEDSQLRKLDPKYNCNFDANSLSGTATGSQFKANMTVKNNGAGSEVEIVVDLPFHLALAKGVVEKTLKKKMDEALG